jgi:hypothetical protein
MPPSHSLQGSEIEDRLDREIASLRQLVENEARGQNVDEEAHVQSASRPRILALLRPGSPDRIAQRALLPPMRFVIVLRRSRRFVRRYGSVMILYGLSIGVTLAVVWLVLSMSEP